MKARRGILDWKTVVNDSNNPAYLYELGQLNVDVYFKPVIPAEKIRLQAIILRRSASFAEYVARGGNF